MATCENCGAADCGRLGFVKMDDYQAAMRGHLHWDQQELACERRAKDRALAEVARLRDELELIDQCAAYALGGPAPLMNGIPKGQVTKVCLDFTRLRAKLARVLEAVQRPANTEPLLRDGDVEATQAERDYIASLLGEP